ALVSHCGFLNKTELFLDLGKNVPVFGCIGIELNCLFNIMYPFGKAVNSIQNYSDSKPGIGIGRIELYTFIIVYQSFLVLVEVLITFSNIIIGGRFLVFVFECFLVNFNCFRKAV